jgi:hypothetical protein
MASNCDSRCSMPQSMQRISPCCGPEGTPSSSHSSSHGSKPPRNQHWVTHFEHHVTRRKRIDARRIGREDGWHGSTRLDARNNRRWQLFQLPEAVGASLRPLWPILLSRSRCRQWVHMAFGLQLVSFGAEADLGHHPWSRYGWVSSLAAIQGSPIETRCGATMNATSEDKPARLPFRRLVLMPWRWNWWTWAVIGLLAVVTYPLSARASRLVG